MNAGDSVHAACAASRWVPASLSIASVPLVLHGLHKLSGLAAPFPPARRYPTGITLPRAGRAKRRHAGGRAAFTTGLKAGALAAIWVPARPAPAVPRPGPPWGPCVPGLAAIAGRRNA